MTKTEPNELDKLTKPTIGWFIALLESLGTIAAIVFAAIWVFSQAPWALTAAALLFAAVLVFYVIDTRLIAEDNQKRLDYLIKKL